MEARRITWYFRKKMLTFLSDTILGTYVIKRELTTKFLDIYLDLQWKGKWHINHMQSKLNVPFKTSTKYKRFETDLRLSDIPTYNFLPNSLGSNAQKLLHTLMCSTKTKRSYNFKNKKIRAYAQRICWS